MTEPSFVKRYAKGIIAVLTAVVAVGAQLLSMGVLPDNVAQWVTIIVAIAGAILTVRVPNAPSTKDEAGLAA